MIDDAAGDHVGADENGLNLLPASPQAAELFQPSSPRLPDLPNIFASNLFSRKQFDISYISVHYLHLCQHVPIFEIYTTPVNLIYHRFYLCVIVAWRFPCISSSVKIFKCGIFPNNPLSVSRSRGMPPVPQSRYFFLHIEAFQILSRGLGIVCPTTTVGLFNFHSHNHLRNSIPAPSTKKQQN